jgi:hypothetical protein
MRACEVLAGNVVDEAQEIVVHPILDVINFDEAVTKRHPIQTPLTNSVVCAVTKTLGVEEPTQIASPGIDFVPAPPPVLHPNVPHTSRLEMIPHLQPVRVE